MLIGEYVPVLFSTLGRGFGWKYKTKTESEDREDYLRVVAGNLCEFES